MSETTTYKNHFTFPRLIIDLVIGAIMIGLSFIFFDKFMNNGYQYIFDTNQDFWNYEYPSGTMTPIYIAILLLTNGWGFISRGLGKIPLLSILCMIGSLICFIVGVKDGYFWTFWNHCIWVLIAWLFCTVIICYANAAMVDENVGIAGSIIGTILTLALPLIQFLELWLFIAIVVYIILVFSTGNEPILAIIILIK